MRRRQFLELGAVLAGSAVAKPAPTPIIDTHIHLFDPTRPGGVPWPPKDNTVLYRPALPDRYHKVTAGLGVVGAIEVECSPLPEDNQWVLDVAAKDSIIVGTIGDLEPAASEFPGQLERLHKNPLFRGIRYGNLWGRDLATAAQNPKFIAGLKLLAQAGLVMDSANPNDTLLPQVLRIADAVPNLRIVIDHLPQMHPPTEATARRRFENTLDELAKRPLVYLKISEVLRRENGNVPMNLAFYRSRLDSYWQRWGEDRVLYGSDWPNSDLWALYPQVLGLMRQYVATKSASAEPKFFWKNALAAYRWVRRNASQKSLGS